MYGCACLSGSDGRSEVAAVQQADQDQKHQVEGLQGTTAACGVDSVSMSIWRRTSQNLCPTILWCTLTIRMVKTVHCHCLEPPSSPPWVSTTGVRRKAKRVEVSTGREGCSSASANRKHMRMSHLGQAGVDEQGLGPNNHCAPQHQRKAKHALLHVVRLTLRSTTSIRRAPSLHSGLYSAQKIAGHPEAHTPWPHSRRPGSPRAGPGPTGR